MFPRIDFSGIRALLPFIGGALAALIAILSLVLGLTLKPNQGSETTPPAAIPTNARPATSEETTSILGSKWIPEPDFEKNAIWFEPGFPPDIPEEDYPQIKMRQGYYLRGDKQAECNGFGVYLHRHEPGSAAGAKDHPTFTFQSTSVTVMGCGDGRIEYEEAIGKAFSGDGAHFWVLPDDPNTVYYGGGSTPSKGIKLQRD